MCPADDTFLSASKDRTVRLWNVQSAGCLAELKLPDVTSGSPLAAFDFTGLVFAVVAAMSDESGYYLHLYNATNYDGGAFSELKISRDTLEQSIQSHLSVSSQEAKVLSQGAWTSLHFNKAGDRILVGTDKGLSIVMDGFEGTIQRVFSGSSQRRAVSCFSGDDQTLLIGNADGTITCWSLASGTMVKKLEGHPGPIQSIASNPKYSQFATGCKNTALWIW